MPLTDALDRLKGALLDSDYTDLPDDSNTIVRRGDLRVLIEAFLNATTPPKEHPTP